MLKCVLFEAIVSPSICQEVMGLDAMIFVFWMLSFESAFSLFSFKALKFLFTFCHKGGVICISEVTDIFPCNLDSSLCFIQPSILHFIFLTQWNCEPCCIGPPKTDGHGGDFWQNVIHWRREWQTTSVFLSWEPCKLLRWVNSTEVDSGVCQEAEKTTVVASSQPSRCKKRIEIWFLIPV